MKKFIALTSTLALLALATPAFASESWHRSSSDIEVRNTNDATVTNVVTTTAETGGNSSTGGSAKAKARGGNATATANGGDAGSANSGDADASSGVVNVVNSNIVRIR